ncbi:MAG TPA: ABC transporter permease [Candidatus Limnocylindrales bacterium]|nr:ABC transporter permease [Candidatus Limnocylindrales bacterium]
MQDLKFALRQLGKNPGFTAIAVATLALGIMAATAMYSVVYAVLVDPFPYRDVDHLMSVKVWSPAERGFRTGYTTDQFIEIAERNSIFTGTIASTISDVLWTGDGDPQRLRGNYGTPNTFQVMGVPPLLGRAYGPTDSAPGAPPVVVLGYRFWQRQFAGDPNVIGRELKLNDKVRTVVGVMPKRFMWRGADVYLPVVFERGRSVEGIRYVHLLGRLKPGVTMAKAEQDLHPIIEDLKQRAPAEFPQRWKVGLLSFKESFPSDLRDNLWILFGAVWLLLLIACANVSNLLLSKAASRQKEMAVRASLGASRARLIRQLLTESLVLASIGCALGVALAYWSVQVVLALVPPNTIPDESEIRLNGPVLVFALIISAVTSVAFGLAPALHACSCELANSLRDAGRGLSGSTRQAFLRKVLVVSEVALSLILLVGAGLMIRTFLAMQNVDVGFRTDRLIAMRVPLSERLYPDAGQRVAFFQQLEERLKALPGVIAVGLNTRVHPLVNWRVQVRVVGAAQEDKRPVVLHQINADYPNAFGIKLLDGRWFDDTDVKNKRHLAVVNQEFVRLRLDGRKPLGCLVRFPELKEEPLRMEDDSFEIVGVVKDTLNFDSSRQVLPEIYFPFSVAGLVDWVTTLTQQDPSSMTRAIIGQVYALDKNQPVTQVRTVERMMDEGIFAGPRFNLALFSVFGALGLTLAVIGIYGVMSNTVAQQTHEIGVRMAIGASPAEVARMVLGRGTRLLFGGLALGLIGSIVAARLVTRLIWNISPFDLVSFICVSLILLLAGLLACVWPARRASKIAPIEALRYE